MTACPKNKTTRGYRPLPCQVPTLVSCRESQISGSSPHSSPENAGSTAAGFSRCRVASPVGDPPEPEKQPRSAAAPAARQSPQEKPGRGEGGPANGGGRSGRHSPAQTTTDGAGRMGARTKPRAESPPAASGTLRLLDKPLPPPLLAAGFLPSSVLIRLTTSL
ncbi:unnamed protein product [Rangifer tarandus platyrhynchus]|uniref:Uncharacterized protein n=1 Tax=Rangifer tarandus platyrhynchus TaxID=3082113 RepID=A0AC59YKQ7_RANTA